MNDLLNLLTATQKKQAIFLQSIAPEKVQEYIESCIKPKVKAKTPVTAIMHTAQSSGKLSICLAQGVRKAYLNADQVNFILDNASSLKEMVAKL